MPTLTADELKAKVMLRVLEFPVPTIARIEGHAIAGGAILALACDLRLALDGQPTRFQMNEVAIGIPVPEWMILIAENQRAENRNGEAAASCQAIHDPAGRRRRAGLAHPDVAALDTEVAAASLAALNRTAYAKTKGQMRQASIDPVLERM